jgi:uncharacterized CHY-type Zn-finger protein
MDDDVWDKAQVAHIERVYKVIAFATTHDKDNKVICGELGVMEVILTLIPKHKNQEILYLWSCFALINIANTNVDNTRRLAIAGGIKHIWRASQIHGPMPIFQQFLGCFKLCGPDIAAMVDAVTMEQRQKMTESCVVCGKTRAELGVEGLMRCSACTVEPKYCSVGCQKAHWKGHKAECKANRREPS